MVTSQEIQLALGVTWGNLELASKILKISLDHLNKRIDKSNKLKNSLNNRIGKPVKTIDEAMYNVYLLGMTGDIVVCGVYLAWSGY